MDQVIERRSSELVQFRAHCRTAISLTVQRNVILLCDEEKEFELLCILRHEIGNCPKIALVARTLCSLNNCG